jgi:phospholipid/cholesterol/gamma-HCH transport system substrate-binding protein
MRYSATALSRARTIVVTLYVVVGVLFFGFLWAKSGGSIPGITGAGYDFSATFPNIGNLAHASDVQMAGVPIGTVDTLKVVPGGVRVTMTLHRNAPLHQGATVGITDKTLIDEAYVLVTDGNGAPLRSGADLNRTNPKAVANYTSLNDVFNAIQPQQQAAAKSLLTEFNAATTGQGQDLNTLLTSLGDLGRNGQTVFDVLAGQSQDLQTLVNQTGKLMGVLDEGQGQIGDLASTSEEVSQATSNSQAALAQTVQQLPTTVNQAQQATGSIQQLSAALTPVANNLQAAAPTLNQALITLPSTTNALRQVPPPLSTALARAPATLGPLPKADTTLGHILPSTANVLSNLNPAVNYLAPYRQDIAAFFSNFAAAAGSHQDANSFYADVELLGVTGPISAGNLPLPVSENTIGSASSNSYPQPGQSATAPTSGATNPSPPGQLPYPGKP